MRRSLGFVLLLLILAACVGEVAARRHVVHKRPAAADVGVPITAPVPPRFPPIYTPGDPTSTPPRSLVAAAPGAGDVPDLPDETGFGQPSSTPVGPTPVRSLDSLIISQPLSGPVQASIGDPTDLDEQMPGIVMPPKDEPRPVVPPFRPRPSTKPVGPEKPSEGRPNVPPMRPRPSTKPVGPEKPPVPSPIHPVGPEVPSPIHPVGPEVPSPIHPVGPEVPSPIHPVGPEVPSPIHPVGPEVPSPIHPVGPEVPPHNTHPVGPELPPHNTHPVGPEIKPSDPVPPPPPMMGEGGEQLPPNWQPDETSPGAPAPLGLFGRILRRMREFIARRRAMEAQQQEPLSDPVPIDSSITIVYDSEPSSVVLENNNNNNKDAGEPVFALQRQEHIKMNALTPQADSGYDGDSEADPKPDDDDAPAAAGEEKKKSKRKHHPGDKKKHHGDKKAKRAERHHDKKVRKAFKKLRKSVTSKKDLLRLRLELHRLESQLGVSSELQDAGVLPPVPAYGGPALSDAVYAPIHNEDNFMTSAEATEGGHHKMPKLMVALLASAGALVLALITAVVCLVAKRKREQRRQVQQSLLPSFAPTAGAASQQQNNIPVAEPVYPSMHSQQVQYGYAPLASTPQLRVN